ncbi:MAG: N-formylglutamate amidohydrolase [Pseudomonadota bacterium]
MTPYLISEPETLRPLVFDSPHSGSIYPDDFRHSIDRMILRRSEDAHADELFSGVTEAGGTLLHALFPRCYIDPNRAEDDLDVTLIDGPWPGEVAPSYKTLQRGVGLIWRDMRDQGPIYDRTLSVAEVQARIEGYWRPYHQALADLVEARAATFGHVIHLNCHTMMSWGDRTTEDGTVARPDFVISDRDGTTAAADVMEAIVEFLRASGATVAVNDPYKGFELVRRHGRPGDGRHSVQIEINRALYMDERTLAKTPGFLEIQALMTRLAHHLAALSARL